MTSYYMQLRTSHIVPNTNKYIRCSLIIRNLVRKMLLHISLMLDTLRHQNDDVLHILNRLVHV